MDNTGGGVGGSPGERGHKPTTDLPRPTILRGSRNKAVKVLVLGLVFEVVGVFLFLKDLNRGLGALVALTCLYLVVQGLRALVTPAELEVGESGLTWRGTRPWQVTWSSVKEFTVWRSRRATAVRIGYFSAKEKDARGPDLIPNSLTVEPEELAALLNVRLAEAQAAGRAPSGQVDSEIPDVLLPVPARPWLSFALMGVLAAVFAAEVAFPLTPASAPLTPSTVTLAGLGGLGRDLLTGPDQWYRFATTPFLHGSFTHLLANGFALFLAGRLLESVVGKGWFAAIYALGALAGGCGSLLLNSAKVVSVGASGAIVALFAAAYVVSYHYPHFGGRQRLQSGSISILLPTLFTVGRTSGGMHIDFGAHLGGAIGGALAGGAILLLWRSPLTLPPHQRLGAAIGGVGLLAAAVATWPVAVQRDLFSRAALLVPPSLMPTSDAEVINEAAELQARFPHDPRLRLAAALGDLSTNQPSKAADEAQAGLHDMDDVRALLATGVEASLWLVLGESFVRRGMVEDAQADYDKATAIDPQLPGLDLEQGNLQLALGRLSQASASADKAAKLQPSTPEVWRLLGNVRFASGNVAAALDAYRRENKLNSSPSSFRMTGMTRFYTGDVAGALFDLQRGVQDGRPGYYSALWLDLVAERSGKPQTLNDASLIADDQDWPAPVLRYFLRTITPDALRRAATSAAPKPGKGQMCEADFYIAEGTLIHGDKHEAVGSLQRAVDECPPDFVEAWMAKAEMAGDVTSPK